MYLWDRRFISQSFPSLICLVCSAYKCIIFFFNSEERLGICYVTMGHCYWKSKIRVWGNIKSMNQSTAITFALVKEISVKTRHNTSNPVWLNISRPKRVMLSILWGSLTYRQAVNKGLNCLRTNDPCSRLKYRFPGCTRESERFKHAPGLKNWWKADLETLIKEAKMTQLKEVLVNYSAAI